MLLKNLKRNLLLTIYVHLRGKEKDKLSPTTSRALEDTEK